MELIQGVKGAPDWLPPRSAAFDHVEQSFLTEARLGGYERVRVPVFEHTEVFLRSVGESTDIVQKEMFTFRDKGDRSLTLRPEGTAGIVRAALEAGLPRAGALPVKWSYAGEFFRHEQPQAGRYRQFTQVGIEALGSDDPVLDAEVIVLGWQALRRAGITDLTLLVNNLGDRGDRPGYAARLSRFLDGVPDLPADVEQRRRLNPLRAFDSKAPGMAEIMARAPLLTDSVSEASVAHFERVVALLDAERVPYTLDSRLVRGLDYYTRTTFEFQAAGLGAQNAVGGGGRYDGLAEDLGWPERFPGIGWALGVDRTVLALGEAAPTPPRVAAFVAAATPTEVDQAFALVMDLRRAGVQADMGFDGRSLKAQMKSADRSGAAWVLVLGRAEVTAEAVTLKDLRSGEQQLLPREKAIAEVVARTQDER